MYDEIEAARRAAELAPPPEATIIPMPEHPYMWPHPLSGIVRFPCTLGCGWAHDEDAFAEDREPIVVPVGAQRAGPQPDLQRAVTAARGCGARTDRDRDPGPLRCGSPGP